MIRSLFLSMGELGKGARRPAGVPASNLKKVGVLGAGLMGAGIAYVSANAGLEVVLIDRDQESADKGKATSDKIVSTQIAKGRAKTADKDALLARIHATADYASAEGLRSRGRGGVRGSRGQGRGDEEGAGRARARRDLRQQHLDPADHFARRNVAEARAFHRRPFLLAGRQDDAGRDHHGREDRREGAGDGDGFRARDQEDADRRQRLPRLLRQPLRRQLHGGSACDGDGGRAAGDGRERRQDGRNAGRPARAQRRGRHRSELANPAGDREGSRRQRRRSGAEEADRDDGRERPALRPQERQGVLRLSGDTARRACGPGFRGSPASGSTPIRSA